MSHSEIQGNQLITDTQGGVAENPTHAAARQRKLAWSSPKLQILHLGRRTDSQQSPTSFVNPESVDYDFLEQS